METNRNTKLINLQNLINISRGDTNRMLKYLNQFKELMPERISNLKNSIEGENRKKTRQILHQMSPQLQFFGIPNVVAPIKRLEEEYATIPLEDLKKMVHDILFILEDACNEIDVILKEGFDK